MKKILDFLEREIEKEKSILKEEFEKRKKTMEITYQRKINEIEVYYNKLFQEKKKWFLEKEERRLENENRIKIEQEFLRWLNEFKSELKRALLNLSQKEKEEIMKVILVKIKPFVNVKEGIFITNESFATLIKKEFGDIQIEKNNEINFGFDYCDKDIEIKVKEDDMIERFFEKTKLMSM